MFKQNTDIEIPSLAQSNLKDQIGEMFLERFIYKRVFDRCQAGQVKLRRDCWGQIVAQENARCFRLGERFLEEFVVGIG